MKWLKGKLEKGKALKDFVKFARKVAIVKKGRED